MRIFRPTRSPEDWRQLLADPVKHWRTGYSAKALAHCWQEAGDFPAEVRDAFRNSGIDVFHNVEMLAAFPEHKVPLPGGRRPSQNDLFVVAKGNGELMSIMVEGKVSEPFGDTVAEWKGAYGKGKQRRLQYLCDLLELSPAEVDHIRYQLLHRTASAVIEAEGFNAPNAVMLVHSFSPRNEWFDDYQRFVALFGATGELGTIVSARTVSGVKLYVGWVKGNGKYLNV